MDLKIMFTCSWTFLYHLISKDRLQNILTVMDWIIFIILGNQVYDAWVSAWDATMYIVDDLYKFSDEVRGIAQNFCIFSNVVFVWVC